VSKQNQYSPFPVERQVVIIYAVNNGYLDELPKDACRRFEQELFERMEVRNKEVLNMIADKAELNAEIEGKLNEVLKDFSSAFKATL
jgi:F-type H+-transporting ATPase subunit alpha